jgi:hypothetical protein
MNKLSPTEIGIQIAGTRLFDYLRDLMIITGHPIEQPYAYSALRIEFGDAIVELIKAIKENI